MGLFERRSWPRMLYVIRNIVYAGASFPIGALADRMTKLPLLSGGYFCEAVAAGTLAVLFREKSAGFPVLAVVFVVSGIFAAAKDTLEGAIPAELSGAEMRGTVYGTLGAVNGVGDLTASAVTGNAMDACVARNGFRCSGGIDGDWRSLGFVDVRLASNYTRVMPGLLYVVSTPIGNLEDITYRAVRMLKEADWIACEDTRTTQRLLDHYGIADAHLLSYHEHNEAKRTEELIARLKRGETGRAGFRCGHAAAVRSGLPHRARGGSGGSSRGSVAGAVGAAGRHWSSPDCRPINSISRDSCRRNRGSARACSNRCGMKPATLIFYEAPHRILESLEDIAATLGDREIVVARELTKMHEEVLRGTAAEIRATLAARDVHSRRVRGPDRQGQRAGARRYADRRSGGCAGPRGREPHGSDEDGGAAARTFEARSLQTGERAETENRMVAARMALQSSAAGWPGREAAWQLAERGIDVTLYEMRPVRTTDAHQTDRLAELVCSNSLKSDQHPSASWLLKEELRRLDSLLLRAAEKSRVPGGQALTVDRVAFAEEVTERDRSASAHRSAARRDWRNRSGRN